MEFLRKRINIKDIYLILVIVLGLITISLYSTYALFTGSSVTTDSIANVSTDINVDFDINSDKTFTLEANTIITFNANIKNNMKGKVHYELYHNFDLTTNNKVKIAEVVEDTSLTSAPNTSGTLELGGKKTVPIVIENKSNEKITVTVGLAIGYVGNNIEYGTGNYPSDVSLITGIFDIKKVPSESCASSGTSIGDECVVGYSVEKINGVMTAVQVIKCPTELENADLSGANMPGLKDGMIPVKWNENNEVVKANATNPSDDIWYDYINQKWANAVLVTSSSRDTYMNASIGTKVNEADILAYFVWIPRYKYKLFNVSGADGTSPQRIEITFQKSTDTKETGSTNGTYLTHPAFSYTDNNNTVELDGIWFGKFETQYVNGGNSLIKPGVVSRWTRSTLSIPDFTLKLAYDATIKFNTNNYFTNSGIENVDAHLIKNMEWGAVAYLSHSTYGINGEITANSNTDGYTGGGSGSAYITNVNQSTTGNVYGIYDMSGGMYDYVMGNYKGYTGDSGFDYSFLQSIKNKYVDIYTSSSPGKLGDATIETKGWYNAGYTGGLDSRYWLARGSHVYIGKVYSNYGVGIFDYEAYYGDQSLSSSGCSGESQCLGYGSGQAGFRIAIW